MSEQAMPDLVLGTAGHIDHGKSSLIMALTGVDPDRLAEEKKRGITIELGFAQLTLPDGRTMGVIDVPGHEKFVKQMIAGATGVDLALLVIAADDGIMPQTVEHIAVLQTLGVDRCVVALTKIDMVDEEWVELVSEDIAAYLVNGPYEGCPIVPVSNRTGEGIDTLRQIIAEEGAKTKALHRGDAMRQPVDRVFTIKGSGTVITGTLWSGNVKPEDMVEILPSGKRCRVRSVQMHDRPVENAPAGNRVALNLSDVKTSEIHPGDFLAEPGLIESTDHFDCHFTYIDTAKTGKPFITGARMHIAHGTKETLGRVLLADGLEQLGSGQSSFAQIRLEEPLPVSLNDRFIVRSYSPVHVAGGGQVLLAHPKRRTNLHLERPVLESLKEGDIQTAVEAAISIQSKPVSALEFARYFGTSEREMRSYLLTAVENKKAMTLGEQADYFINASALQRAFGVIDRELVAFHAKNPSEPGMAKGTLHRACFEYMEDERFDKLLEEAIRAKKAVVNAGLVGHPNNQGAVKKAEEEAEATLTRCLKAAGMTPPSLVDLAKEAKVKESLARRVIIRMLQEDKVYRINSELYYDGDVVRDCKQRLAAHAASGGDCTTGGLRDVMGVSRKYAVPLLEAFDAEGFTTRNGDERIIRQ